MDANRDGVGDFQGLTRRLDYLHGLGITTIWLMPFQPSPYRDDGYDISDYYGVDSRHGTLGDFVEVTHGAEQPAFVSLWISWSITPLIGIRGFKRRAVIPTRNIATGIFGPIRSRPTPTREWCFREYRNRPGLTTRPRACGISTACTIFNPI